MNLKDYDECQLQLACIPDSFYLDAMTFINNLDGLDRFVAERVAYTLKCYLVDICQTLSQTLKG